MRLLIVDDDPVFGEQLKLSLESRMYTADYASNLKLASEMLIANSYKVLLLDYDMGLSKGLNLIPGLSRLKHSPGIVLMTAYGSKEVAIECLNSGVNKFIEKPFSIKSLEELLKSFRPKAPEALWRLDPVRMTVCFKGREVSLTKTEFVILNLFLNSEGALITKEELHKLLYKDHVKARNALASHLTNLKKKVPFLAERLKSIHGKGYVFENIETGL